MSFLSVTRALVSGTNPTEAQLDTMRTDLLNYFNGTSMNENNFAAGGLSFSKLSKALDNAALSFTSNDALIKFVSATPTFRIENTLGDVVFTNTKDSETESLRFTEDGYAIIGTGGLLRAGTGRGSTAADTTWLVSRYRKPRLEYVDDNVVSVENNTGTADQTVVLLQDRLTVVCDRTMSLSATANGYDAADTGAAVSGIRDGLARANNTWYFIYAVLVQYGTDNDGTKSILVADTTSPVQANAATLNSVYGTGAWVYLGIVRNGYNDGSYPNIIVNFVYDEFGMLRFTSTTESGKGNGLLLASANSSSSDLTYTLTFGTGASDLPVTCPRGIFTSHRSSYQFFTDYVVVATSEVHARVTSLEYTGTATGAQVLHMEVPILSGYKVVVRIGASTTNQRIMLAGLVDHYL